MIVTQQQEQSQRYPAIAQRLSTGSPPHKYWPSPQDVHQQIRRGTADKLHIPHRSRSFYQQTRGWFLSHKSVKLQRLKSTRAEVKPTYKSIILPRGRPNWSTHFSHSYRKL